jgi:hypothetical protein
MDPSKETDETDRCSQDILTFVAAISYDRSRSKVDGRFGLKSLGARQIPK